MDAHNTSIFVQIASYRDPELLPTLIDLINKAKRPQCLRAVVCWQHSFDETLDDFGGKGFAALHTASWDGWSIHQLEYRQATVELIDVPHLKTHGACWARNLLQQRYGDERYTLHLDSHHRFIEGWDDAVIAMLESLRDESPKPVLTTYLPAYDPGHPEPQHTSLPGTMMIFERFSPEGVVLFNSMLCAWESYDRPFSARFYSAHFAFADGHFAQRVQHDPEYFFHGEEISIAVRAFTHGYDLYHPHRVVAWHEYTRRHRIKMWEDHDWKTKESGVIAQDWVDINNNAMQRNRELFGIDGHSTLADCFGKYGFGTERSVADYEAYAGISFAYRGVQRATLEHQLPVRNACRPDSEEAWKATLVRANDVRVCLHQDNFIPAWLAPDNEPALNLAASAHISFYTRDDILLHEKNLSADELAQARNHGWLDCPIAFHSALGQLPARYVVELFDKTGKIIATTSHTLPQSVMPAAA